MENERNKSPVSAEFWAINGVGVSLLAGIIGLGTLMVISHAELRADLRATNEALAAREARVSQQITQLDNRVNGRLERLEERVNENNALLASMEARVDLILAVVERAFLRALVVDRPPQLLVAGGRAVADPETGWRATSVVRAGVGDSAARRVHRWPEQNLSRNMLFHFDILLDDQIFSHIFTHIWKARAFQENLVGQSSKVGRFPVNPPTVRIL